MCYQIPGDITEDGKPIVGGKDIDPQDYAFSALIYPKSVKGQNVSRTSKGKSKPVRKLENLTTLGFRPRLGR